MEIIELKEKSGISDNINLNNIYQQFQELLKELRKRELPDNIVELINRDIEELNSSASSGNELRKLFKKKQNAIVQLLEKELKIVPKSYYQNLWFAIGMSVFGLPIGIVFGMLVLDNMAFFAIGILIGMVIGMSLGSSMDKKAFQEGRQLDLMLKY
ncbi:MAG: hypothetical protein LBD23_05000 [Oscillospiraceae bacterium]|nr:hypothetical protein [Oscillospiraceae bacterium]